MPPPSAAQSRAGAVAPAPRGFPVFACPESIAQDSKCLLLTHMSIRDPCRHDVAAWPRVVEADRGQQEAPLDAGKSCIEGAGLIEVDDSQLGPGLSQFRRPRRILNHGANANAGGQQRVNDKAPVGPCGPRDEDHPWPPSPTSRLMACDR